MEHLFISIDGLFRPIRIIIRDISRGDTPIELEVQMPSAAAPDRVIAFVCGLARSVELTINGVSTISNTVPLEIGLQNVSPTTQEQPSSSSTHEPQRSEPGEAYREDGEAGCSSTT